ncbi:MAG: PD-(D/E)XK nuclease family protein [Kineosporiaceae bacterium]
MPTATLQAPPATPATDPARRLDPVQAAAVAARGPVLLLGAAGTGRTTTVVAWAAARLGRDAGGALVVCPTRAAARRVGDLVARAVAATLPGPVARTPQSLAWAVLREHAAREGLVPPRLVTGGETDLLVADLLAGHEAAGDDPWPDTVPPATRATRAFRADLRELWSRVVERGLGPQQLADLGRRHGRPEWVVAATLLRERSEIAGLRGDNAWDPAEIVDEAAALARADPSLGEWARSRVGATAVAVDDAQDLTAAGWRLLTALAPPGGDVLVAGDPDLATQGFRGASPRLLTDAAEALAGPRRRAARLVLPTSWRHDAVLAAVARAVSQRIGVVTAVHRAPDPPGQGEATPDGGPRPGSVRALTCPDGAAEAATVAALLRAHHHDRRSPLPWDAMAVVVRSQARAQAVRLACRHAGVPVVTPGAARPLRDEPAAAVLLRAAVVAGEPGRLDGETLRALACGPLGGGDAVRWRRLVRAVRPGAPVAEGASTVAEAVRPLLDPAAGEPPQAPPWPGVAPDAWRPVARVLHALRPAVGSRPPGRPASAVDALWAVWSATGLAEEWRATALAGGPGAAVADADLDAVTALFETAEHLVDRLGPVPVAELAARIRDTAVRDDDLARGGDPGPAVTVTTPAGAAGREWDLVVVAGVQDGAWPDLRVRGSVLRTPDLLDVLDGRGGGGDHRAETLDDELRLFQVAVTRARRYLVVTAVDGDSQRPSRLFSLVAGHAAGGPDVPFPAWHGHRPDGVVALLRRAVVGSPVALGAAVAPWTDPPDPATAARLLARLAAAGVPGAHPDSWGWLRQGTDPRPRHDSASGVRVSPSQVERFHTCPLQWYLGRVAVGGPPEPVRVLGVLLHEAAQRHPTGTPGELADRLLAEIEAGWDRMGLTTPWVAARERERARGMVERLARWAAGRDGDVVDVLTEVEVDAVVDGVRVRGSVDRLERLSGGDVRVVDLKTGAPGTKAQAVENLQLAVYQLALQMGGAGPPATVRDAVLVHVGGPATAAVERMQPGLAGDARERARVAVTTAAEGMAGAAFPARPGAQCERCAVRTGCPAVAEGRPPGPAGPGPS